MNQPINWNTLFGEVPLEAPRTPSSALNRFLVRDTPTSQHLQNAMGDHFFEHITATHKALHSNNLSSPTKKQLQETYHFFERLAIKDLALLEQALRFVAVIQGLLYPLNKTQQNTLETLLQHFDRLMAHYLEHLLPVVLPVRLKTNAMARLFNTKTTCNEIHALIARGDLKEATTMLLGFHYPYSKKQANLLYQARTRYHGKHLQDFLKFLKYRLHSTQSHHPNRIDYTPIEHTYFLSVDSVYPTRISTLLGVFPLLNELKQLHLGVVEPSTRLALNQLAIAVDSFIKSITA